MADGAEIDGVVEPQPVEPVLGHHPPGLGVTLTAPVELVPAQLKAVGARRSFHRGDPLGHDLVPYAVASDYRDPITLCHQLSSAEIASLLVPVPDISRDQPPPADLAPD